MCFDYYFLRCKITKSAKCAYYPNLGTNEHNYVFAPLARCIPKHLENDVWHKKNYIRRRKNYIRHNSNYIRPFFDHLQCYEKHKVTFLRQIITNICYTVCYVFHVFLPTYHREWWKCHLACRIRKTIEKQFFVSQIMRNFTGWNQGFNLFRIQSLFDCQTFR